KRSNGLPPFLASDPGTDSGLMIAQYTAAGIVSELKRLAAPASADSIPSSAMQEDHVSMGWAAARKLRRGVDGLTRVLGIELLTAARGVRLRAPLEPAPATAAVIAAIDAAGEATDEAGATAPGPDRFLAPDLAGAVTAATEGTVVTGAETVTGRLEYPPGTDKRHTAITRKWNTMEGARPVRAPRGTEITAKSWQTEAPLRMLMNNLDPEVAERPDDLVVYGG